MPSPQQLLHPLVRIGVDQVPLTFAIGLHLLNTLGLALLALLVVLVPDRRHHFDQHGNDRAEHLPVNSSPLMSCIPWRNTR